MFILLVLFGFLFIGAGALLVFLAIVQPQGKLLTFVDNILVGRLGVAFMLIPEAHRYRLARAITGGSVALAGIGVVLRAFTYMA